MQAIYRELHSNNKNTACHTNTKPHLNCNINLPESHPAVNLTLQQQCTP
ncbi:MAG: hypothetical protein J6V13_06595 [Paludibacteraceae bacterium]|nr:hypothetical protein [Paludibacteraceae bacterium]